MQNLYQIEANGRTYERRAWTGGDVPDIYAMNEREYRELVEAFYQDQIFDASFNGKLTESEVLAFWECAGTTPDARREIFMTRARLDAWRTLHP